YLTVLETLQDFVPLVGQKILQFYEHRDSIEVTKKSNATPLTEADVAAHNMIVAELKKITPDVPVLSEEGKDIPFSERKQWDYYWLVDPLDGTKEFLEGNGEFTVNIALIEKHESVAGIIYQPTTRDYFFAAKKQGAYWRSPEGNYVPLHARIFNEANLAVLISRHHTPKWLTQQLESSNKPFHFHGLGSSLKFCRLASGLADVYPRMGPTSEWDTAAGQCIVEEAGGAVLQISGEPLRYNTKDELENPSFLAVADKHADWSGWFAWLNERATQQRG
ncbi:MAG: 3'(2'),5'-bisphosphate nucleotidase CysQ, partial [Gammaproteobacteria bacterium]